METAKVNKGKEPKSSKPSDLRFANPKVKWGSNVLMMKVGEPLDKAKSRLKKEGWNVDEQPFIRQGRVLRAVGQRVKSAVRNIKRGDQCTVEFYDILESETAEGLDVSKVWERNLTFEGTKGIMHIFKTEMTNSFIAFPIGCIANITKLMPLDTPAGAEAPKIPATDISVQSNISKTDVDAEPAAQVGMPETPIKR